MSSLPTRTQLVALLAALALVCGCGSSDSDKDSGGTPTDAGPVDTSADDQGAPEPDKGGFDPKEFGKPCTVNVDKCNDPYTCVQVVFGGGGFCTKQCTNQGVPCNGAPAGTTAYCIVKDAEDRLSCAFVCEHPQLGKQKCPEGLKCSETNSGGGLKICEPDTP